MISATMNAKLNEQVTIESGAAHKYLAMACKFDGMGLKNLYKRFMAQYEEELGHAMKIVKYVLEVGGTVNLDGVPKPEGKFDSVKSMVQIALDGERFVTKKINELVDLAESEKDYATRSFLQWFVDEQVEEEAAMGDLLRLVELARDNVLQIETHVRHMMIAPE